MENYIKELEKDFHLHWNVEAANFFAITLVALPRPLLRVPRHPEITHLLKLDCIIVPVMPAAIGLKTIAYHSLGQGR